jgi:hypothetical protein
MRFRILEIDDSKKLLKLSKIKKSFFAKKEDLSLFHFYEIKNNMYHVIFQIADEYLLGTKRSGNYLNVPFSQYINCFFFTNARLILIEDTEEAYIEDIKKFLKEKTNAIANYYEINKNSFEKLVRYLNGFIKKIEYHDKDGDDYEAEFVPIEKFLEINLNFTIDYISLNVDQQFISIYRNGKISVDNSDEEYLIKFAGAIINELEGSTF